MFSTGNKHTEYGAKINADGIFIFWGNDINRRMTRIGSQMLQWILYF